MRNPLPCGADERMFPMSVLKEKRTTSKAEYVNTANQIYVKTVDFLSRLSARYSRLIAADTARLAGQAMDTLSRQTKSFRPTGKGRSCGKRTTWRPWPPCLPWMCA